jgi:hypothetical protein
MVDKVQCPKNTSSQNRFIAPDRLTAKAHHLQQPNANLSGRSPTKGLKQIHAD